MYGEFWHIISIDLVIFSAVKSVRDTTRLE